MSKRALITSWNQNSFPLQKLNVPTQFTLRFTLTRGPVILIRQPEAKRRNELSVWRPWSSVTVCFVRHQSSSLKLFSSCESVHFWWEKSFCFFTKRLLCCMLIFFYIKMKKTVFRSNSEAIRVWKSFSKFFWSWKPTQCRCVFSQSALSNHALLITKSAFVIKVKCPLSQPISVQSRMW